MKKITLPFMMMILTIVLFSQTSITDSNFQDALKIS